MSEVSTENEQFCTNKTPSGVIKQQEPSQLIKWLQAQVIRQNNIGDIHILRKLYSLFT